MIWNPFHGLRSKESRFIYHSMIRFDVSRSKNFFPFFLFTLPSSLSTLFAKWIKLSKKGRFSVIYHATIWFDVLRSKNFFSFFLFTLPSSLSTLFANWIKLSKKDRFIYHPKSLRRVTIQARNVFFFLSITVSLVIHAYEYSLQRKWAIISDEETIAKRYSSARYNNGNYNYSYSLGKLGKRYRQLSFERGWTFCPQNLFTNDKILFFFERWTDRCVFVSFTNFIRDGETRIKW